MHRGLKLSLVGLICSILSVVCQEGHLRSITNSNVQPL
jgi:hypothetical protein